ncbi:MAG TPA: Shedu anti-phage system protein SduA domain-containing protein [Longimicrobiales bacterium]
MTERYPYEFSLEQVLVERRKSLRNPNIGEVYSTVLKEGLYSTKIAVLFEILDPRDKVRHHYSLKLETLRHTKKEGWQVKPERSITLEGDAPDEIAALVQFINSITGEHLPEEAGRYVILKEGEFRSFSDLVALLRGIDSAEKVEFIEQILKELREEDLDGRQLAAALRDSEASVLRKIAVASRLGEYRQAYDELITLIQNDETTEHELQSLLERNPWMFGSEYSELLDRRRWSRDDEHDFMLRRTSDGYLEVVEIKTPFSEPLFRYDKSRGTYYPSSRLSQALGQVMRYIDEVDRYRNVIIAKDKEDPLKIRARLILGKDGGGDQQAALRNFNSHLIRIEVLTFDQLARIAKRVLAVFEEELDNIPGDGGVPAGDPFADDDDDDLPF